MRLAADPHSPTIQSSIKSINFPLLCIARQDGDALEFVDEEMRAEKDAPGTPKLHK